MNFIEYKYKDIGKIRSGKRLKKGYIVSDKKTNNRYIRVRDINNGIIDVNNVQYISDEAASYITRYKVSKNDIIISVVGTVGSVASIPNELDGAYLTENCNNLLVDEKICLKEYLKYFLLSRDGQAEILSHIVGTTQPKLPIYGIEAFNIKIPEKECQNKIIKILNTINNKISLNTQINNSLLLFLLNISIKWFIKSYDLAFDININILDIIHDMSGRSFERIECYGGDNKTIYLGKGDGRVKIYNKKRESNIDILGDLTRIEISREINDFSINFINDFKYDGNFPLLYLNQYIYSLSDYNDKTLLAILYAVQNGFDIRNLTKTYKNKIKNLLSGGYKIAFNKDICSDVIKKVIYYYFKDKNIFDFEK